jgi:hypothetical protein
MKLTAFRSIVYLQIRRRWLSVRVLTWSGGDFQWQGPAEAFVTTNRKGRTVLIEADAARANPGLSGRLIQLFAHPRVLIDGYPETRDFVEFAIRQSGYKSIAKKLIFLIHVRDQWEGGLADIELRVLREIATSCGAGECRFVDQPYELSPPEILEIARSNPPALANR